MRKKEYYTSPECEEIALRIQSVIAASDGTEASLSIYGDITEEDF